MISEENTNSRLVGVLRVRGVAIATVREGLGEDSRPAGTVTTRAHYCIPPSTRALLPFIGGLPAGRNSDAAKDGEQRKMAGGRTIQ